MCPFGVRIMTFLMKRENSTVHLCPSCDSHFSGRYLAVISSAVLGIVFRHGVPVQDANRVAIGDSEGILLNTYEKLLVIVGF